MFRISPLIRKGASSILHQIEKQNVPKNLIRNLAVAKRRLSSEVPKDSDATTENNTKKEVMKFDMDEYDDYEPQTKSEKVSYYGTIFLRLLFLAGGLGLAGFTIVTLMPSRMNAQSVFNEVFDLLQNNDDVREITGDGMKAFGRDTGRNTEGRRNHIDSYEYVAEDGSKRTRVRFNIKGNKGQVHVWVEVSKDMADNEYVYLICQNARSGRVLTVVDNRDMLEAGMVEARKNESWFSKLFSTNKST